MPEGQPMPDLEPKTISEDLYDKSHEIANEIRALKKEFYDSQTIPERREDIVERYKILKAKREDTRMVLLKYLNERHIDPKTIMDKTKELMQKAERNIERSRALRNNDESEKDRENWYEAYDFVRLLERENNYLKTMELENED